MHVNTHLDNEVGLARLMGVKYMAATIEEKFTKYAPALQNVFLTGDFNTSDSDPIFKSLVVHS
jgi:1,4-alpha-glucan branching enzyme